MGLWSMWDNAIIRMFGDPVNGQGRRDDGIGRMLFELSRDFPYWGFSDSKGSPNDMGAS